MYTDTVLIFLFIVDCRLPGVLMMLVATCTLYIISAALPQRSDSCVVEEVAFRNCSAQFNSMEESDSFWESICSIEGKQTLECMLESSRECPQFWLIPNSTDISYQRDLILSISPLNSKYDVACERHTESECDAAWNCYDTLFSMESYIGLSKFYSWFCGGEYGITYVHKCFVPAEDKCPTTLEHLRNREMIKHTNSGESFIYRQLEEKALSECADVGGAGQCLSNMTSQCYTAPEINFGQATLQCNYTDITEPCVETACGLSALNFFLSMFEYLKCGSRRSTRIMCEAEETTIHVGDISMVHQYTSTFPGTEVVKNCPAEYKGTITRFCDTNGDWGQLAENCSLDISSLQKAVDDLKRNGTMHPELFQEVVDSLTSITTPDKDRRNKPLLGEVTDLIDDLTGVFVEKPNITEEETEGLLNCVNNAVDKTTEEDWNRSIVEENEGASTIMHDVDRIVKKLRSQLCPNLQQTKSKLVDKDNLDVTVGNSEDEITFQSFSKTGDPKGEITLSADAIQDQGFIGKVCYGGVDYATISSLLTRKVLIDGETTDFDEDSFFITDVISLLLERDIENINPPLQLKFLLNAKKAYAPKCVSWDFSVQNMKGGAWSTRGCSLKNLTETEIICSCTHLTNFAVLMSTSKASDEHAMVLGVISIVGCAISIFALILTIIFHLYVWRSVRSDRSTILMHLCVALLLALAVFLAGINRVESAVACTAIAATLHYLLLVVFVLMLTRGIEFLVCVVHVIKMKFQLKRVLPMAWLIPLIIVASSLAITKTEGYGNKNNCWLSIDSGLIWAFIGPATVVIFINIIVIIVVFKNLCSTRAMRQKTTTEKTWTTLRGICVLLPLMGVTWAFGILSVNIETVVFQYIFAVCNSLQGFFIFLFHCVFNRQVSLFVPWVGLVSMIVTFPGHIVTSILLNDALRKRGARKRSMATFESDLKKRSRGDSLRQDVSTTSGDMNSDDKISDSTSRKYRKMDGHRARQDKQVDAINEWQKEQRKEHQRYIRRQIADRLEWTQ